MNAQMQWQLSKVQPQPLAARPPSLPSPVGTALHPARPPAAPRISSLPAPRPARGHQQPPSPVPGPGAVPLAAPGAGTGPPCTAANCSLLPSSRGSECALKNRFKRGTTASVKGITGLCVTCDRALLINTAFRLMVALEE